MDLRGGGAFVYGLSLFLFLVVASIILLLVHERKIAHENLQRRDEQLALINRGCS
jgi:hypothetical protein